MKTSPVGPEPAAPESDLPCADGPLEDEGATHYYLPIPDPIFHSGFYVTSAGHSIVVPGGSYPPARHPPLYHFNWRDGRVLPEFSLMLITAGSGVFESKPTGSVRLSPGTAVILFPGVWHRYRPDPETGWTDRWMHFNGEFAHQLLDSKLLSPEHAVLTSIPAQESEAALRRLLAHAQSCRASNSLLLSLQGLGVLAVTLDDAALTPPAMNGACGADHEDSLVSQALDYIWSQSHRVLSVPDVARALGVTRRKLERHLLAARGRSVLDEIIECRFNRAERLLRETELPIKSVVDLAGFGSLENMRRVFVKRRQISPADYRHTYTTFPPLVPSSGAG